MAARMKEKYTTEIAPALLKKFGYKSVMQIPKLDKIIVNVGCGESKNNAKEIEAICKDIATMDICICTTATTDEEAKELLTQLGAPFYN